MKRTIWYAVAAAAAAAVAAFWLMRAPSPNLVLIVVDTLRADALGSYGAATAATPRLDALAAAGARHDLARGSFHQTTASMGAMFLGRTPSLEDRHGSVLPWNRFTHCGMGRFGTGAAGSECLPLDVPTVAERLRERGYETVGVCSNSLLFRPAGFDRGFEAWREVGDTAPQPEGVRLADYARKQAASRDADRVVEAALAEAAALGDRPFFLYAHFMDVHDWWTPGDRQRTVRRTEHYFAAVERVDAAIGRLLDGLEARGLLHDTVIVLTADHGESLGEPHPIESLPTHQGNPTYETVARIPLIVRDPSGRMTAAMRAFPMWRTQDLSAILAAAFPLASEREPEDVSGAEDSYYSELLYRTLRHGRWKITCPRGSDDPGRCALFDLEADPAERNDLARERPDQLEEMRSRTERIAAALRATGDVAAPGARSREEHDRLRALGYAH